MADGELEVIIREPSATAKPAPLLFVHGILHGAWCWDAHFLPYFAEKGYVAAALSLRGHAGSPIKGALRWASIADYVADVAQVADSLAMRYGARPIIIGHSMGGFIAQKYLERYEAPAGVLVASVPTHGVILTALRVLLYQPMAFITVNLKLALSPLANTVERARWAFFSADMPDAQVQSYVERFGEESYRAFLDMLLLALPRPKRVSAPVLVVAGETDPLFSLGEERALAEAYHGECLVIAGCAHDVMLEAQWQTAADGILKWLGERGL